MRGDDERQASVWSYIPLEQRVPADHPLRPMRAMVDAVLAELSPPFQRLYARVGRPSIAPERLLRALLLQVLYSVRSERLLMEQLDYNLLFRWFVGLQADDPIWDATVFTKNRQRLLEGDIARPPALPNGTKACCWDQARGAGPEDRIRGPRAPRRAPLK
jgi:transposase